MHDWRKEKVYQRIWELNKPGNELGSPPWVSEVMALSHYARPPSTPISCVRCVWVCILPLAQAPEGYMKSCTTSVRLLTHQTCNTCLAQVKWVSLVSTEPSQVWGSRGCSGGIAGGWYLEGDSTLTEVGPSHWSEQLTELLKLTELTPILTP